MNRSISIIIIDLLLPRVSGEDSRKELRAIRADILMGSYFDADKNYIISLAERHGIDVNSLKSGGAPYRDDCEEKLAPLRQELARAHQRIFTLEARIQELVRVGDSTPMPQRESNALFAIKKAFARKYHPDGLSCGDIEKLIRAEIFKEFWNEIEMIERRCVRQ